jgi:phosphomannomutase/phosphoglucomutase
MNVPRHVFREYDIRGIAETDLTSPFVTAVGRALVGMFQEDPSAKAPLRLVVARDCRLSSDRIFTALAEGLVRSGVEVVDIGVGPTPYMYSAVHQLNVGGGIMVTASHNPSEDNGLKIMRGKGSFFGSDLQELCRRVETQAFAPETPGGRIVVHDFREPYVTGVTRGIRLARTDLRFVLDGGNGSGGPLGMECMRRLGLSPDGLFVEMDGRFPNHHPDPTVPKNLEALIDRVRSTGARVGLAFDGDADRLGVVDGNGEIVWGDRLLLLFARALLKERPGATVIGEVKCSQTLYDDIAAHGGVPLMWKTGHSLIKTKMKEVGAPLAGEMSGHMFFGDRYFGFDDALYAALRILEIIATDPRSLSEQLGDVPVTHTTPEIRVQCPDAIKVAVVDRVRSVYRARGLDVNDIDGARITFDKGTPSTWGLVRASNTGPVLVLRFEAATPEARDRARADLERAVAEARRWAEAGAEAGGTGAGESARRT